MAAIQRCIELLAAGWPVKDAVRSALHAAGVYSADDIRDMDPVPEHAADVLAGRRLRPGRGSQLKESVMAKAKKGKRGRVRAVKAKAPKRAAAAVQPPEIPAGKPARAPAAGERLSLLDAAVEVLRKVGAPMRCKVIVEGALVRGLWTTTGKTPAATLSSAILRELKTKGPTSRFKKEGRGLFGLAGHAAEK